MLDSQIGIQSLDAPLALMASWYVGVRRGSVPVKVESGLSVPQNWSAGPSNKLQ